MASDKEFTADEVGAFSEAMRERMRPENYVPSHTHKSLHDIEKALDVGRFGLFLMWVAKADKYALSICTDTSKNNVMGLGKLVVFTTTLAFCTSWYTISSMMLPHEPFFSYFLGPLLAMIYAFGIFLIDREIVSAVKTSIPSTIARLVFAAVIALTVSYPIKLLLLDGAIQNEIQEMIKERHAPALASKEGLQKELDANREQMRIGFEKTNAPVEEEIRHWQGEVEKERVRFGRCAAKCDAYIDKLHKAEDKLTAHHREQEALMRDTGRTKALDDRIKSVVSRYEAEATNPPSDLLTKWEASGRLGKKVEGAAVLQWFLIAFFLCVELIPMVMKLALGKSEYSYYLDARNTINIQKIISITNYYMGAMQTGDPDVLKKIPAEVSDIIQYMMEDEANRAESDKRARQSVPDSATPSPGNTPVSPRAPAAAPQGPASAMDETTDESPVRG